jgi:hypothetical protein
VTGEGHESADTEAAGDSSLPAVDAAEAGSADGPIVAADIASALAADPSGSWSGSADAGTPDLQVYDGHVALALDPGALAGIDSTLDLLVSSHDLFDVPVADIAIASDDVSPA